MTPAAARDAMAMPPEDPKRPGCCNRWVARQYGLRCNRPLHHRGGCAREEPGTAPRAWLDRARQLPKPWPLPACTAIVAALLGAVWLTLYLAARALGVV